MNRWLRRVVYLFVIVVWLAVMGLPILAFSLAGKGELHFGEDVRLFLVQEEDAEGVGIEWKRPLPPPSSCFRTTVTYIMWQGRTDNTAYCQCYDLQTGSPLPAELLTCEKT